MGLAKGLGVSALVLVLAGGFGVVGSWAVLAGAVLAVLCGVTWAGVMDHEGDSVEDLVPRVPPGQTTRTGARRA